ncbi:MAG: SxtJ family membrane protein [Chitinophagaceae bacterium]
MKDNKAKSLETLLVLTGALIIVYWYFPKKIYLLIAFLFILIGVVSPFLSAKISWVWLKFAEILGSVMSKIILSIVYFVFLVPIALIYRLTKKNPLFLKRKEGSYYTERNKKYSPKEIENIW